MAILKFGPTVVGLRGTLGGITFSANKSGPYARNWQRPPKVQTLAQNAVSVDLSTVAKRWADITPAERTDWDTWAAGPAPARFNSLGEPLDLSGFNWFCGLNTKLLLLSESIIDSAPLLTEPAAPAITLWRVSDDNTPTTQLNWTGGDFVGFWLQAEVAQAFTLGAQSFARNNYKIITKKTLGAGGTNMFGVMNTAFGELSLGRLWFLRARKINFEGLVGPTFEAVTETVT